MNPIILTKDKDRPYLRLDLDQDAGVRARDVFLSGAEAFVSGINQFIRFDPGYKLTEDECFEIADFPIPEELIGFCRQPLSADRIDAGSFEKLLISGVVGYDFSAGHFRLIFQNFDSKRILIPGRKFAIWPVADQSTFRQLTSPVLLLDANITAIWENGILKFKSFHLARQLFDLSNYFKEATDDQIVQFASHSRLRCADPKKFPVACNNWSRIKIALILRGGLLDNTTSEAIREAAAAVEYPVQMEGERVILPEDKYELRALLQFLDEDVYRGPISQRKLLSSGKRECQ